MPDPQYDHDEAAPVVLLVPEEFAGPPGVIQYPTAKKNEALLNIAAFYGYLAMPRLPLFPVWVEIRA